MPPLDEKDMIDQLADGWQPAAGLQRDLHGVGMRLQPSPPLLALVVGVTQ